MGILGNIFGMGKVARDVGSAIRENTEVFHVNETEEMGRAADRFEAALAQYSAEFQNAPKTWFGESIDGLNRLPRPVMALGTISLFVFAFLDPNRFSIRMEGLQEIPDPLWWLIGAIVSFYFGARELHYFRNARALNVQPKKITQKIPVAHRQPKQGDAVQSTPKPAKPTSALKPSGGASFLAQSGMISPPKSSDNPAIQDWLQQRSSR